MSMTCATRITTNNCQKKTKNVMKKILLSLSLLNVFCILSFMKYVSITIT